MNIVSQVNGQMSVFSGSVVGWGKCYLALIALDVAKRTHSSRKPSGVNVSIGVCRVCSASRSIAAIYSRVRSTAPSRAPLLTRASSPPQPTSHPSLVLWLFYASPSLAADRSTASLACGSAMNTAATEARLPQLSSSSKIGANKSWTYSEGWIIATCCVAARHVDR